MSDQSAEKIQAHVRLTLMDHLRLQLWCRWIMLPRTLALFVGSAAAGAVGVSLANGRSLSVIAHNLLANGPLYGLALLAGFLAIVVLIPAIGTIRWLIARRRSRETTFFLGDDGVGYSAGGIDVNVRWEKIVAYSATNASVLIRGRRLFIRLPKRAFSDSNIQAIMALFARKGVRRVAVWQFN